MPYNLKFYKTESATARCLAGMGPQTSYTASTQSIIAQRDVDRKALGWAQAAAQSMLECTIPGPAGVMEVAPLSNYDTEGDKGGSYPTAAYVITNTGTDDLDWLVEVGAAWLTGSPLSGHLYVGESRTITFGVDDTALAAGTTYNTTMDLVNESTGQRVSYLAQVTIYPIPQVSAAYASELGTATLVGFSELASPSLPPKKYLTKTLSGQLTTCNYSAGGACPNSPGAFNFETYGKQYSGSINYNPNTGVATNSTITKDGTTGNGQPTCGSTPTFVNWVPPNAFTTAVETLVVGTALNRVTTPTSSYQTSDFSCVAGGIFRTPYPERIVTCTARDDLSNEDTEDAAIARAVKTPGTSAQAYRELRGAGDFTLQFQEVTITLDFTALQAGLSYQATIDLNTENYGGGGSVVTQRTYNFTAAATTHQIVDTLSAADGKQVTASNPAVVRVP